MSKKILYLFFALLLPALIFVFLKYFGKNEFDIPVYYQNGIGEMFSECKSPAAGQYTVPDSVLRKWNWNGEVTLASCATEKANRELSRLVTDAKLDNIHVATFDSSDTGIKKCILFMTDPWDAVLIDKQRRIRGYYKLGNRDEMDRLEVELKILLKKY